MVLGVAREGSSVVRAEFRKVIDELESTYERIELQLERRVRSLVSPSIVRTPEEFRTAVTEYLWSLYCPELERRGAWIRHRDFVEKEAFCLLEPDYGRQAKVRTFDLARTGVAGGLRGVLNQLFVRYAEDLARQHGRYVAARHREQCGPQLWFSDAKDYISEYRTILPPEMVDGGAAVALEKFEEILSLHAITVSAMRRQIRR